MAAKPALRPRRRNSPAHTREPNPGATRLPGRFAGIRGAVSTDRTGDRGAGWTVGVEEEFLLADPDTGRTAPAAARVLDVAARRPGAAVDAALHTELAATQVEAATGAACRSSS